MEKAAVTSKSNETFQSFPNSEKKTSSLNRKAKTVALQILYSLGLTFAALLCLPTLPLILTFGAVGAMMGMTLSLMGEKSEKQKEIIPNMLICGALTGSMGTGLLGLHCYGKLNAINKRKKDL